MRRRRQDPISLLAGFIAENRKVAVIVGAGLSAASGVPVFRGDDPNAIWVRRATSMGTKAAFLRDPLAWYNEFWFPLFKHEYTRYLPNAGHEAIARLTNLSADLMVVRPFSSLCPPLIIFRACLEKCSLPSYLEFITASPHPSPLSR
jgi:hypothetical protein